jgi:CheY-like chemotaxis protein
VVDVNHLTRQGDGEIVFIDRKGTIPLAPGGFVDRSEVGLGIGLRIVERLLELDDGSVEAHGPVLGSEFVVGLASEADASSGGHAGDGPRALRVLVVDDNEDYADGVALLLRRSGYEVEVAYGGPEALQLAVKFRPDVVVMDIGMPGMDGYEVASRMRQDPDLEGMRLVGVSGYREEAEGPRSRAARFDGYLMKPVLLAKLEATLRP